MLQTENILLRALEPEDLSFLYKLENDSTIWEVSSTLTPYSKFVLKDYLANSHKDIYEVKQLRLVIVSIITSETIGFIDLFDFDPKNRRVGVGIIIASEENKQKGYAAESLSLVIDYVFNQLLVHQVHATITDSNIASIGLFEKLGFKKYGVKKDWLATKGEYKDVFLYQLISE
ncbi:GNAT family N-acetyltransferase [Patiriisocius hiemis]|uniref:GNAT family protein n=1 Tax=Patiriisocius hiemis TaxID=3075604 RepID=A0ABU2YBL0_9FLAO|nr:GNAT family protein [Constantimarinum sp. W242]MDT0555180.1 GNAT family protein [Constantimarinum sp. W242]